jgi:hypothetical protein
MGLQGKGMTTHASGVVALHFVMLVLPWSACDAHCSKGHIAPKLGAALTVRSRHASSSVSIAAIL